MLHPLTGSDLIAEERARQIAEEGWTPGHDDEHVRGQLAKAAAFYASPGLVDIQQYGRTSRFFKFDGPSYLAWPFDNSWCKPGPDRKRELVKAGALIAAEIDRLLRKERAAAP